jgi:hypothetical protein
MENKIEVVHVKKILTGTKWELMMKYQSVIVYVRSRGSSVSIMSDYGLDDRGSIPDRVRGFLF